MMDLQLQPLNLHIILRIIQSEVIMLLGNQHGKPKPCRYMVTQKVEKKNTNTMEIYSLKKEPIIGITTTVMLNT